MRDSCDLCNLTTGPVVKLHANTFKLIQNDTHLLDNVSGLSLLLIYLSNEHLVEFDISCGITEAKNMKTDFFLNIIV